MSEATENPIDDPVLSNFELPLSVSYFPLGFPLELETNSPEVMEAAEECWGRFERVFEEPPVRMRVGVLEGGADGLPPPVVRARGHLMAWVAGRNEFGVCDMRAGIGFCWLTAATASNRMRLRYHYLESMGSSLIECLYLAPVHAACVARNGRGVLLCGDSRAGKSSLAYACAKRGWTYICDDACELVRERKENVVLGNPHLLRLREPAVELFPELRNRPVTLRLNGDRAIELATADDPNLICAPHCWVDCIVFLNRQSAGAPALAPYPREKAWRWLEQVLSFGERETLDAQAAALARLLTAEVLEFRYSGLDSAVTELESLVCGPARPLPVRQPALELQDNA